MELKDQVVLKEQAIRLYELGIKGNALFYHTLSAVGQWWISYGKNALAPRYAAYTASEIGEMLPCESGLIFWDVMYNDHLGVWYCRIHDLVKELKIQKEVIAFESEGDTMAECMADALIHCLENKLVTP